MEQRRGSALLNDTKGNTAVKRGGQRARLPMTTLSDVFAAFLLLDTNSLDLPTLS
jgi:hypothetical protein